MLYYKLIVADAYAFQVGKYGIWEARRSKIVPIPTIDVEEDIYTWEEIVRCTVHYDGTWTLDAYTWGAYSQSLEQAWNGEWVDGPAQHLKHDHGAKEMAADISQYILMNTLWETRLGDLTVATT